MLALGGRCSARTPHPPATSPPSPDLRPPPADFSFSAFQPFSFFHGSSAQVRPSPSFQLCASVSLWFKIRVCQAKVRLRVFRLFRGQKSGYIRANPAIENPKSCKNHPATLCLCRSRSAPCPRFSFAWFAFFAVQKIRACQTAGASRLTPSTINYQHPCSPTLCASVAQWFKLPVPTLSSRRPPCLCVYQVCFSKRTQITICGTHTVTTSSAPFQPPDGAKRTHFEPISGPCSPPSDLRPPKSAQVRPLKTIPPIQQSCRPRALTRRISHSNNPTIQQSGYPLPIRLNPAKSGHRKSQVMEKSPASPANWSLCPFATLSRSLFPVVLWSVIRSFSFVPFVPCPG